MALELKNRNTITNKFKMYIRYKDDIMCIPYNHYDNNNQFENEMKSNIYPSFDFETENNKHSNAHMCDIELCIKNGIIETSAYSDPAKFIKYQHKTSNIKQDINGILKTLRLRYIVICSNELIISQRKNKYVVH